MHSITSGEPFLLEHRFRRKDGAYRWQLSRAIPQRDAEGKIQMWVGTSTDIDEIKQHERQKDDFIKVASHELKTPITTVKGYVQLLLREDYPRNDPFMMQSLVTIDRQVSKLTKLVGDLLDTTKIEMGGLTLNKKLFQPGELVKDIINYIQSTTKTHSFILHQHADPFLFADKDRLEQALVNLLTNAEKYSPLSNRIVVNINADKTDLFLSVQDFGIGIADEEKEKIFSRFYRVSGRDEHAFPGFGIGLFIVKEIISLHGGKVWVESEKGHGSTFHISLPLMQQGAYPCP
jgi:signal transduction histidine kinase